jgi:nitrite reductase (NO-forming)
MILKLLMNKFYNYSYFTVILKLRNLTMTKAALFLFVAVATTTLYSCGNSEPKSEGNPFTTEDVKGTTTADAANGEAIYKRACASCHMAGGDGIANVYPPLAKSDYLANRENTIKQVIKGSSGEMVVNGKTYNNAMPPQQLNDDEVAAVLTYVYTNMGNSGTPVTAAEVAAVRAK